MTTFRIEHDSMGELKVPADALYGAQTQRAIDNFPISGLHLPRQFIRALGLIKAAAAEVNLALGHLKKNQAAAIRKASLAVADGQYDAQFPIDIFQTGSGTSTNMNANEVIAHLAVAAGAKVHPNDHVNYGQSSNDVIPTAIHVSAALTTSEQLLPALKHLKKAIDKRARELRNTPKTGRTHLMDAMPITFGQELSGWSAQIASAIERIEDALKRMRRLPQGGTAVGTGINADPKFGPAMAAQLKKLTGVRFESAENYFEGMAAQDAAVELSGAAEDAGRRADEDRQRLALDEFRPAGRPGRDRVAGVAAGLVDHAGQGQSGDSRGRRDGRRAGDRQRCLDHHRRPVRQLPAQRDVAADRTQPAAVDRNLEPTSACCWPTSPLPASRSTRRG